MKRYEKLILIVLVALLAVSLGAMFFTRDWPNYRDRLRALQGSSKRVQELVDTRPLETAQQLAPLAVTHAEQNYAAEALRLGDRSADLAFAAAMQDAVQNPPPMTPQTRQLTTRIKADEAAVAADESRITQFTQVLAKTPESAKDDVQGLITTAQAQQTLDQDDLDAAKQELILAGGDEQAKIQQLLDQHEASDAHSTSVNAAASSAAATPSIERTRSRNIVAESQAWNSLHSKELQLIRAQQEAQALVTTLSASRAALQKEIDEGQVVKKAARAAATSALPASAATSESAPPEEPSAVSVLRNLSATQKNIGDLGKRVDVEQQLATVYGNWITFADDREKSFLHEIFVSIFWALLIAEFIVLANAGVQRFFADVALEHRQLRTIQAVLLFSVQALGVLLILLVIFGVPGNLATVLALAGAGLTVALKDFIVGFFGWFVLMGKDGIRAGDWVEINGVGGEVLKVGLLHTVMLETGNWTDAGHPTGRKVTFVNSFAIEGHYFNFSTSGQWLWDEIQILIPEGAEPYAIAEAIQKIAAEETGANARLAEEEWNRVASSRAKRSFSAAPSISVRPSATGVNVVLRYLTRANERHQVRARLYRAIVELLHKRKIPESAAPVSTPGRT
ncbi:MAG TPA: mechanosensitive ion channel domain-containing protein [Candidatus Acidoferrales bacterium]|nr:mechanosensitive ion channel domain-containing protein [Candidatus Acidoferrales bacterium]